VSGTREAPQAVSQATAKGFTLFQAPVVLAALPFLIGLLLPSVQKAHVPSTTAT
jgi:hypothetical protein